MPVIKGACVLAGATWPYTSSPRTLTLGHGEAWDLTTNPAISEQPAPHNPMILQVSAVSLGVQDIPSFGVLMMQ